MKFKAAVSWGVISCAWVAIAQAPPDLSRSTYAPKTPGSALGSLIPALVFFLGVGLVVLVLLLGRSGGQRPPPPPGPQFRRFGRFPHGPPPGPMPKPSTPPDVERPGAQ